MCTSYVIKADKRYIGMNFDISDRPIKLSLTNDGRLIIYQRANGAFLPAIGMNREGTFMNLQMVEPNEAGQYRRGKNVIHIMKLFDDMLSGKLDAADISPFLSEKFIVNVPDHSVHSLLCTGKEETFIVSPGREHILGGSDSLNVLTNFPLDRLSSGDSSDEAGMDRYRIVERYVDENSGAFSIEKGFTALDKAKQSDGEYPTQLSIIFLPEDKEVFFAIKRNFERLYRFSFMDEAIFEVGGERSWRPGKKGILLSELSGE